VSSTRSVNGVWTPPLLLKVRMGVGGGVGPELAEHNPPEATRLVRQSSTWGGSGRTTRGVYPGWVRLRIPIWPTIVRSSDRIWPSVRQMSLGENGFSALA